MIRHGDTVRRIQPLPMTGVGVALRDSVGITFSRSLNRKSMKG
jgi:hypothetical protein